VVFGEDGVKSMSNGDIDTCSLCGRCEHLKIIEGNANNDVLSGVIYILKCIAAHVLFWWSRDTCTCFNWQREVDNDHFVIDCVPCVS
jgi:hypothetical protein